MPTLVAYTAPDPAADYWFSVADVMTGNSYSPKAGNFAPAPADELMPMHRDLSPHRPGQRYGFLTADLVPPVPGQYLVFVHPKDGGPPAGDPFPLVRDHPDARLQNFAVSY